MKPNVVMAWPPVITDVKVPRLVVLRDYLVTLGAWLLLLWLAEHEIVLIVAQVHELMGGPVAPPMPDWSLWLGRMLPYAVIVSVLAVWLIGWGVATIARGRSHADLPQPVPLSAAEQAVSAGCAEADLLAWRDMKVAVVHIDAANRIRVEPGRG